MTNLFSIIENKIPDPYARQARIYPVLLLLLPILLTYFAIVPKPMCDWKPIVGLLVWCGVVYLLKEIGRGPGKRKEKELWNKWGGPPTTQYLRHRGDTNKVTLKKIHNKLKLICGIEIPTEEEEKKDPEHADMVYGECTRVMISKTRDQQMYPLLFNELCSYGFWRNTWGLRPWGITISLFCTFANGFSIYYDFKIDHVLISYNGIICNVVSFAILIFWLKLNENMIKIPAFSYAIKLFEATETNEINTANNT